MSFDQLPFVAKVGGSLHAWVPPRSNDYHNDCQTGRLYFNQLRELMIRSGNVLLLSRVLQAQVEGGRWEGVEIGFSQAMSEAVLTD